MRGCKRETIVSFMRVSSGLWTFAVPCRQLSRGRRAGFLLCWPRPRVNSACAPSPASPRLALPRASRILPGLVRLGIVERRDAPPTALFRLVPENVASEFVRALSRSRDRRIEAAGPTGGIPALCGPLASSFSVR